MSHVRFPSSAVLKGVKRVLAFSKDFSFDPGSSIKLLATKIEKNVYLKFGAFYLGRACHQLCRGKVCVLVTLSSPPSFLLSQTLSQELSFLFSCSIRLQWVPGRSFLPGNNAADEPARRGVLLATSAVPCSLSTLNSCIHSCLFSDWRRTDSSKFFDTQAPSIATEEPVLPRHARCVLSRLWCNGHTLLLSSYLSKIGRIDNPCCSACGHSFQDTSHLIVHCPTTDSLRCSVFGDSRSLYDLWSRP